eukprot:jgi/Orpsp1_1/1192586/evm.model.d7180000094446.1
MIEVFPVLINEYIKSPPQDENALLKKNNTQKTSDFKKQKRNIKYNISYNNIVFTTTTEKLVLKLIIRKAWKDIKNKYNKSTNSYVGDVQEQIKQKLLFERTEKGYLIEWFSNNYLEIIKEMYYKLAYVEKIISLKNIVFENSDESISHDPHTSNGSEENRSEEDNNNDNDNNDYESDDDDDMKRSDFIIQPLKVLDTSSEEPICYLWYIPSPMEIIM